MRVKKTKSRSNQGRAVYTKYNMKSNLDKGKSKIVGGEAIGGVGKAIGKEVVKKVAKTAAKKPTKKQAKAAQIQRARKRAATRKLNQEETGKARVYKKGPGRLEYEATLKELGIVLKKYPRKFMGENRIF